VGENTCLQGAGCSEMLQCGQYSDRGRGVLVDHRGADGRRADGTSRAWRPSTRAVRTAPQWPRTPLRSLAAERIERAALAPSDKAMPRYGHPTYCTLPLTTR
jgi:hypothetical protein